MKELATVKCQFCGLKENRDLMKKGITKTGYIHMTCTPSYEEQQKQKEIEKQQWDELYEYLIDLHQAIEVPTRNIKLLRELKESKKITYSIILNAYKIAEDKIKWFIDTVLKGKNDAEGFKACYTMMINHGLNQSFQQEIIKKKREELLKQELLEKTHKEDRNLTYKTKSSLNDISSFL